MDLNSTNAFLATTGGLTLIIVLSLWSLPWKGIALWKAARRDETV